ncbi:hypothetical protein [Demequina maris]|nr:hypothetical protein [Demequina maris]
MATPIWLAIKAIASNPMVQTIAVQAGVAALDALRDNVAGRK